MAQLKGLVAHSKDSPAREQLDLDQQELRRREKTRSEFIRLRLESYKLSLVASDKHCDNLAFPTLGLLQKGEISHFQLSDFCKRGKSLLTQGIPAQTRPITKPRVSMRNDKSLILEAAGFLPPSTLIPEDPSSVCRK